MHTLSDFHILGILQSFIDWIIDYGGLYILLLVVFAETGLFIGFFFPGDSLLFAAGVFLDKIANRFIGVPQDTPTQFGWPHITVIIMIIVASILGNIVGYWFGRKTGPLLYERKETWLFKRKHLVRATEFYNRYGKSTIFLAKFLPIVRTFAPIVAGIVKMDHGKFMFYNITGSLAWVSSMMLGGYFLDSWVSRKFGLELKDHIEAITIGIILVTTLPVLYKLFFAKKPVIPPPEDTGNKS
ncbi:MAG: VTT domain-containing protein [Chitinophagaceae bacterium]|nr:VTT domain-containing protein [Chitinophagaceae bacterium]